MLFDIDGTLVDTGGAGREALDAAFEDSWDLGDATRGVVLAGGTDPEIVREVLNARLGLTADQVSAGQIKGVLAHYLAHLPRCMARAQRYRVLPGVEELLSTLAARPEVMLGLCTGNITAGARLKLAKAQLNKFFRTGGFGAEARTRAGIVAVALDRLARIAGERMARQRVLLVGDTVRDIRAGLAAGVVPVGVCTGPDSAEALRAEGARLVLPSLAESEPLLAWLQGYQADSIC